MKILDQVLSDLDVAVVAISNGKELAHNKSIRTFHKVEGVNIAKEVVTQSLTAVNKTRSVEANGAYRRSLLDQYQQNGVAYTIARCEAEGLGLHATVTELNRFGLRTPKGRMFSHQQVKQVRKLLAEHGNYLEYLPPVEVEKVDDGFRQRKDFSFQVVNQAKKLGLGLGDVLALIRENWDE